MMEFEFALPLLDSRPVHKLEIDPARVQAWLNALAPDSPTETARIVADALSVLNRIHCADTRRLQLLEMYNEVAEKLWPSIRRQFNHEPHPLNRDALQAARSTLHLMTEVSTGYKRLLAEDMKKLLRLGSARLRMGLIHRAQQSLARVLMTSFFTYCPVPAGSWLDLHQVYLYARRLGLHQQPINPTREDLTPEVSYVQTILLALANPYAFLPGQLSRVVTFLTEHGRLARLTATPPTEAEIRESSIAAIYTNLDHAPRGSAKMSVDAEPYALFLTTTPLVSELERQLSELAAPALSAANPNEEFLRMQHASFLRQLFQSWRLAAPREPAPLPKDGILTVNNGFARVWQCINASGTAQSPANDPDQRLASAYNLSEDATGNGYELRNVRPMPTPVPTPMRIGELLALQPPAGGQWQIAVVRWFRNTLQPNTLELGCEILARGPVAVIVLIDGTSPQRECPALLFLYDSHVEKSGKLLVRPDTLSAHCPARVRLRKEIIPIVIGSLREQSAGFAQFEFAYA